MLLVNFCAYFAVVWDLVFSLNIFNEMSHQMGWRCLKCGCYPWGNVTDSPGIMPKRSHTSSQSWRSNPIIRMRTSSTRVFYVSQLQLLPPQPLLENLSTVCESTPKSYLHIILPYHPATPPQTCICTIKLYIN